MTQDERIEVINKISRTLSILMCDMKLHQSMNIYALNIHAEDFYCNVFNFLYQGKDFNNANSASSNEAYIDLVDHKSKHMIQVTTSTGKDKIDNSLKILESYNPHYKQYEFDIFFLLDKPKNLQRATIESYKNKYGIEDIRDHLKDHTDLLNDIKILKDGRLRAIYEEFFKDISEKYTDEMTLQIVFDLLVKDSNSKNVDYSVDFNNVGLEKKIGINNLNRRVSNQLLMGSEASLPVYEHIEGAVLTELRVLIVDGLYTNIIKQSLSKVGAAPRELARKKTDELHHLASKDYKLDFSAILGELCHKIEDETYKVSYQETSMAWVIIAYFFEECDIGMKQ